MIDVEMCTFQKTRSIVLTTIVTAETSLIQGDRTIRTDVILRTIAHIAIDQIGAKTSVRTGGGGAIVDVRLTARRRRSTIDRSKSPTDVLLLQQ